MNSGVSVDRVLISLLVGVIRVPNYVFFCGSLLTRLKLYVDWRNSGLELNFTILDDF